MSVCVCVPSVTECVLSERCLLSRLLRRRGEGAGGGSLLGEGQGEESAGVAWGGAAGSKTGLGWRGPAGGVSYF